MCTENMFTQHESELSGTLSAGPQPVTRLYFFLAPCDPPPGQSIRTAAATTVLSSPLDDSLSSVCLPFIRTLVAGPHPDVQPRLAHKENISFLGCCYYNLKISFAFMATSHLESLFDVVISWAHGAPDNCHTLITSIM